MNIAWKRARDAMNRRVEAALLESGITEAVVRYDAYKDDENGIPISNLDDIAYHGTMKVVASNNFISEKIVNPTFLQLAMIANQIILSTNDYHRFFEGIESSEMDEDGVLVARLFLGS